ncbi:MAG: pilus assembly protein [Actinomycetaceae bacterium]|nr:pilus assembly protein [Arcanobacterium sp.]MDD7505641.1 pilus assembly protein [Actinomycetaceae bacterium]MDY6143425.1 TadE family protein [Arcanobacterium sp.]
MHNVHNALAASAHNTINQDSQLKATREERGMVTAEWAITAPVFIMAVIVCIVAIVHMNTEAQVSNAAHEAARMYAIHQDERESAALAREIAGSDAQVEITTQGDLAQVTVTQPHVGLFSVFGYEFTNTQSVVLEPSF